MLCLPWFHDSVIMDSAHTEEVRRSTAWSNMFLLPGPALLSHCAIMQFHGILFLELFFSPLLLFVSVKFLAVRFWLVAQSSSWEVWVHCCVIGIHKNSMLFSGKFKCCFYLLWKTAYWTFSFARWPDPIKTANDCIY